MRWVKVSALLSLWVLFFALVVVTHLWVSVLGLPNRWKIVSRLMRSFALIVRSILNIKVSIVGDEGQIERSGYVVISNHTSYVDGIILGSIFPILFVSKREVKSWPIIGQWNTLCGTVYIDRQRRGLVSALVREMTAKLSQQANILLFPEGTSTNGDRLLPFQTVPLAAPLRHRAIIVPVTLVYTRIEDEPVSVRNRDLVYWYGDMEFLTHFWKLLSLRGVEALVTIQPKIECFRYDDNSAGRKKLARDCYDRVLGKQSKKDLAWKRGDGPRADDSDAALSS
jgi:1-acyl-sn-glycerol-3-phosphate acyltransferase